MSVDNFVYLIHEMCAGLKPFSYYDLTQEYGKLRNSHEELLAALEDLIVNVDAIAHPKRLEQARAAIAKARGA